MTGDLGLARRLFATCLEFPGGLKIQTIHAFCQSILARFPLEAGLSPNQRVMDDRTQGELLLEARDRLLLRSAGESDLVEATDKIASLVDEETFTRVMGELTARRAKFDALYRAHGTTAAIGAALRKTLGLTTGATEASIIQEAAACDDEALREAAAVLLRGAKTDQKIGQTIADWLAGPEDRAGTFFDYAGAYLVTNLTKPRAKMMTKGPAEKNPGALETLQQEQARMEGVMTALRALRMGRGNRGAFGSGQGTVGILYGAQTSSGFA